MPSTCASFGCSRATISSALAERSSSGLSVIERRPLLVVGFVPSEPMNEATFCTSGSPRMTSASDALQLHHLRERDVRRRLRHAEQRPRVLLRKEALRDEDREHDRQPERRDRHEQREELVPEDDLEPAVVERDRALEGALGPAIERAALVLLRLGPQEVRAHHRASASATAAPRRRSTPRASPRTRGRGGR